MNVTERKSWELVRRLERVAREEEKAGSWEACPGGRNDPMWFEREELENELARRRDAFVDAEPKHRPNTPTKYEVAAVRGDVWLILGFTARKTWGGLMSLIDQRREELLEATGLAPDVVTDPVSGPAIRADGWKIGFTGRTELTVQTLGNEGAA